MTYSHLSRDFADFIRPVMSLCSKSEAAYPVKASSEAPTLPTKLYFVADAPASDDFGV